MSFIKLQLSAVRGVKRSKRLLFSCCMYFVYILYSKSTDRFYIGHTYDVEKRLHEHNHPEIFSRFTAKGIPWELVLSFEISDSRGDAMRVEKFIKKQKTRSFIQKLITNKNNRDYLDDLINKILK